MLDYKHFLRFRPDQALKTYKCYRQKTKINSRGKPLEVYDFEHPYCTFEGIISKAKQSAQVHYQQLGHTVTHEVIVFHRVPVGAGDCLVLGNRKFYVHDIRDPGEIGQVFCIMTEEDEATGRVR